MQSEAFAPFDGVHLARRAYKTLYEALEALPEGLTAEILDGQLHTEPQPGLRHMLAVTNLSAKLLEHYAYDRAGPRGWWIVVEPELHFAPRTDVLVPDLAGWRRERVPELPDQPYSRIVPDWICEVLSPATRSKDREIKLPLYARYGVGYAWLVDPKVQTLESYELRDGQYAALGVYGPDAVPMSAPFEGAMFRVADLWR